MRAWSRSQNRYIEVPDGTLPSAAPNTGLPGVAGGQAGNQAAGLSGGQAAGLSGGGLPGLSSGAPQDLDKARILMATQYPKQASLTKSIFDIYEKQQQSQATLELAKSGRLTEDAIAKIAVDNPQLANQIYSLPDVEIQQEEGAQAKKKKMGKQDAERILTMLENLYYDDDVTPRESFVQDTGLKGKLQGLQKKGAAKFGENPELLNYMAQRESVRPFLARAVGEVGNLNITEQEAAVRGVPSGSTNPEEAKLFFKSTRAKLGLPQRNFNDNPIRTVGEYDTVKLSTGETIILPVEDTTPPPNTGVDPNAGASAQVQQPIPGQGPLQAGLNKGFAAADNFFKTNEGQSPLSKATALTTRGILAAQKQVIPFKGPLAPGNTLNRAIYPNSNAVTDDLSQGQLPNKGNLAKAGVETALTALPGINLPKVGGLLGLPKVGNFIGSKARPIKMGSEIQKKAFKEAADRGATVNTKSILNNIDKWAAEVKVSFPTTGKQIDKLVAGAKGGYKSGTKTIDEATNLWDRANRGYTGSGHKAKGLSAEYDRFVRANLEPGLEKAAPGFSKGKALIAKGLPGGPAQEPWRRHAGTVASIAATGLIFTAAAATLSRFGYLGGGRE